MIPFANLIGEMFVSQAYRASTSPMEPWIPSAQADQLLVQAVDEHTFWSEFCRRARKGRANDIVTTDPVFLHAPERLFVARIDRRRAAARE
jgi:hypothetical protein